MKKFAYEARDEEGRLTGGMIAAESLEQAGHLLSQRNLFVVRLGADTRADALTPSRASTMPGRASRTEVAWCMSQLSIMVETGIRLSEALDCLTRQATRPQLRTLLENISKGVQEGRSLSEAMAMYPKTFPPSLTALIRASEMSGTMTLILQRSSGYLMNEMRILRRVRGAIIYPAFMFFACLAITVFLLTVILPRFADIFAARGAALPLPTRVLMDLSNSLISNWYYWASGTAASVIGLLFWSRTVIGRQQLDYLTISVPVFSTVFNSLYQGRSFRTMAVLLDAGVTLVDAMKIMQQVVPNTYYRELWRQVDQRIQLGESLAGPMLNSDLIPEPIAQMIDTGDRAGKLAMVFGRLADYIEEQYDQAVKTATQFIEPCMILIMGGIIGFVAAALMLPLFQASQVVAQ